jgi:hypothetical protein
MGWSLVTIYGTKTEYHVMPDAEVGVFLKKQRKAVTVQVNLPGTYAIEQEKARRELAKPADPNRGWGTATPINVFE